MYTESFSSPPRPANAIHNFNNLSNSAYANRRSKVSINALREKVRNKCLDRINKSRAIQVNSRRNLVHSPSSDFNPFFDSASENNLDFFDCSIKQNLHRIISEEVANVKQENRQENYVLGQGEAIKIYEHEFDPDFLYQIEQEMLRDITSGSCYENAQNQAYQAPGMSYQPNTELEDLDALQAAEYEEYEAMFLAEQTRFIEHRNL